MPGSVRLKRLADGALNGYEGSSPPREMDFSRKESPGVSNEGFNPGERHGSTCSRQAFPGPVPVARAKLMAAAAPPIEQADLSRNSPVQGAIDIQRQHAFNDAPVIDLPHPSKSLGAAPCRRKAVVAAIVCKVSGSSHRNAAAKGRGSLRDGLPEATAAWDGGALIPSAMAPGAR